MKLKSLKHLFAIGAALAVTSCAYADFTITFDTPTQSTEWSGSGAQWTNGPVGWAGGGGIQTTNNNGGWTGSGTITINFSYSSGHQPDMWSMDPNNAHVSFDIIVDGTSFNANAQWWQIFGSGNSSPNGWTQLQFLGDPYHNAGDNAVYVRHVDVTFAQLGWTAATAAALSYYQLNLWANSDGANPIKFYVDNVSAYVLATVHPTNSIAQVTGPKGLTMITSSNVYNYEVGSEQYQRQDIRTLDSGFTWYGSTAPVTYSLTITNFPDSAHSNFVARLWLVDGVATENAPDYNEPNLAALSIQNNADGTGTATFQYKTNSPFGFGDFFASGNLGNVSAPSVLGTWSLTLSNDLVIVTAPNGNAFTNSMNPDASSAFNQPLRIYLVTQAIRQGNINQKGVYSKFQVVSNSVALLSDNFSYGILDPLKWVTTQTEDAPNVYVIPTTAAYKVSWTVPDGGFSMEATPNLSGTWFNPALPKALIGGKRTTFIPASFVATNGVSFFRLKN